MRVGEGGVLQTAVSVQSAVCTMEQRITLEQWMNVGSEPAGTMWHVLQLYASAEARQGLCVWLTRMCADTLPDAIKLNASTPVQSAGLICERANPTE